MEQFNKSHLIGPETKEPTPLSSEYLTLVGHQLRKLARHFRRDLDEMEILTYLEGLKDLPLERIEAACQKALFRLRRMPMIADLRELVTEQGTEAVVDKGPGKYCEHCYPDGWRKRQGRMGDWTYYYVVRCECQKG